MDIDGTPWSISSLLQVMVNKFARLVVASAVTAVVTAQELHSVNGVYDTSTTPSSLPWNTYNYCNAPHVNAAHYTRPTQPAELVYMNVMTRHHKVSFFVIIIRHTETEHTPWKISRGPLIISILMRTCSIRQLAGIALISFRKTMVVVRPVSSTKPSFLRGTPSLAKYGMAHVMKDS